MKRVLMVFLCSALFISVANAELRKPGTYVSHGFDGWAEATIEGFIEGNTLNHGFVHENFTISNGAEFNSYEAYTTCQVWAKITIHSGENAGIYWFCKIVSNGTANYVRYVRLDNLSSRRLYPQAWAAPGPADPL